MLGVDDVGSRSRLDDVQMMEVAGWGRRCRMMLSRGLLDVLYLLLLEMCSVSLFA